VRWLDTAFLAASLTIRRWMTEVTLHRLLLARLGPPARRRSLAPTTSPALPSRQWRISLRRRPPWPRPRYAHSLGDRPAGEELPQLHGHPPPRRVAEPLAGIVLQRQPGSPAPPGRARPPAYRAPRDRMTSSPDTELSLVCCPPASESPFPVAAVFQQ